MKIKFLVIAVSMLYQCSPAYAYEGLELNPAEEKSQMAELIMNQRQLGVDRKELELLLGPNVDLGLIDLAYQYPLYESKVEKLQAQELFSEFVENNLK